MMYLIIPIYVVRKIDSRGPTCMKKGVEVIANVEAAKLLVDPMRREIIRLLADKAMTENELAETLGLSDPSVGHHDSYIGGAGRSRQDSFRIIGKLLQQQLQRVFHGNG